MIDANQFRELIIRPILLDLGMASPVATELVLGVALKESGLKYVHQLGKGPALGFYQMEPFTHDDIWKTYLVSRPELAAKMHAIAGHRYANAIPPATELIGNIYYATAMCRVRLYRAPEALPEMGDVEGMANYWKKWYNTPAGAGKPEEFIEVYNKYAR